MFRVTILNWDRQRAEGRNLPDEFGSFKNAIPTDHKGIPLVRIVESSSDEQIESLFSDQVQSMLTRLVEEDFVRDDLVGYDLNPTKKVLFSGPPGCGKLVAARILAERLGLRLWVVQHDTAISPLRDVTKSNLRKLFDFARKWRLVLFFGELDEIGRRRTRTTGRDVSRWGVRFFQQMLEEYIGEAIVVAATTNKKQLEPQLLRRFDEGVEFKRPTVKQIELVIANRTRQVGVSWWFLFRRTSIARRLVGMSFADVVRIADDATKTAILAQRKRITTKLVNDAITRQKARHPRIFI